MNPHMNLFLGLLEHATSKKRARKNNEHLNTQYFYMGSQVTHIFLWMGYRQIYQRHSRNIFALAEESPLGMIATPDALQQGPFAKVLPPMVRLVYEDPKN